MQKQKFLSLSDIFVLSLIFFGLFSYFSLIAYWQFNQAGQAEPEHISINELANYYTTIMQMVLLVIAFLYLRWRKFDFSVLDFRINRYTLPLTLLLVISAGLIADAYQYFHAWLMPHHYPDYSNAPNAEAFYQDVHYTPQLIFTSLFNGFFEELFFIGFVFATPPKTLPKAVLFSLIVRFVFHTYQGLAGAFTITTLGISFWLFRRKITMLVPFFLAHSLFDIFGLGILNRLFSILSLI